MKVVGRNAADLLRRTDGTATLYYTTNSVTLGGGESVDVILDTAEPASRATLLPLHDEPELPEQRRGRTSAE